MDKEAIILSLRNYLQNTCNKYGDFLVANSFFVDDERIWTKHRSVLDCWQSDKGLYFLDRATHRTPHPHEIILDIDDNPTPYKLTKICEELEQNNISYLAFFTGSKGYHIHLIEIDRKRRDMDLIITKFQTDMTKISDKSMVAIENVPHWKTGKIKTLLRYYPKKVGEEFWQLWKN